MTVRLRRIQRQSVVEPGEVRLGGEIGDPGGGGAADDAVGAVEVGDVGGVGQIGFGLGAG